MSIRKKLALWLCPELSEQLSACRTAWAKHCLSVSGSEGTDFLNLDEMTEPERAEAELMQQAVAEQFAQLMSFPAASAVRAAEHAALSASSAMVSADKARARVEPMTAMGTAGPEAVAPRPSKGDEVIVPRARPMDEYPGYWPHEHIHGKRVFLPAVVGYELDLGVVWVHADAHGLKATDQAFGGIPIAPIKYRKLKVLHEQRYVICLGPRIPVADEFHTEPAAIRAEGAINPFVVVSRSSGSGWAETPRTICISESTCCCSYEDCKQRGCRQRR